MIFNQNSPFPVLNCDNKDSSIQIICATPHVGRVIHRFFDTSPFSPSGRYLALTRLACEERLPRPGDVSEIVIIDLVEGREWVVADSRAADSQLGAQVQWGGSDEQLFFNDLDTRTWKPYGILANPFTLSRQPLEGTVYMVSEDGRSIASPCLLRTGATQAGYGVVTPNPPRNHGASKEDGLYVTDVASGKRTLLVSFFDIVSAIGDPLTGKEYEDGDFYAAHVKWNRQADRLMLVLRWLPHGKGKMRRNLVTLNADGTKIAVAISEDDWGKGGHHPNWCPDGKRILMNLVREEHGLSFVSVNADGTDLSILAPEIPGSGHPTLHPNQRQIVTDAYPHEKVAKGDGRSPIRLIDVGSSKELKLAQIPANPPFRGKMNEMRVDLHPAWDRAYRRIAFNGFVDGTRRVFFADLTGVLHLQ